MRFRSTYKLEAESTTRVAVATGLFAFGSTFYPPLLLGVAGVFEWWVLGLGMWFQESMN